MRGSGRAQVYKGLQSREVEMMVGASSSESDKIRHGHLEAGNLPSESLGPEGR